LVTAYTTTLKKTNVKLWIRPRANKAISIEDQDNQFVAPMAHIGAPLRFGDDYGKFVEKRHDKPDSKPQ
jgi:hypothetical protein